MSNLEKKARKAVSWNALSVLSTTGRLFISSIILNRLLEPADFGYIGIAMMFAYLFDSLFDLGFSSAVIREKGITEIQKSTIFYINMISGILLSGLMFLSAGLVADFFEMPIITGITHVLSLSFIVKGLVSLQKSLMNKELNLKSIVVADVVAGVFQSAVAIFLAYKGYGVWSLVYSQVLNWVIVTVLIWTLAKWRPMFAFDLNSVKSMFNFGYKEAITQVVETFFNRLDSVVIGKIFNESILGYFFRAKTLNKYNLDVSYRSFFKVVFPSFTSLEGDDEAQKAFFVKILSITFFTSFLSSGLLFVNASESILIMYGDKWVQSIPVFKIFCFFTYSISLSGILKVIVLGKGMSGSVLYAEIINKVLVLLSIPVAYYYGLNWYLIVSFSLSNIGLVISGKQVEKYLGVSFFEQARLLFLYLAPFTVLIVICELFDAYYPLNNLVLSLLIKGSFFAVCFIYYSSLIKSKGYLYLKALIIQKLKVKFPFVKS